jgi:outer membrane protein TolC
LIVAGARRQLVTLTGVRPDDDAPPLPADTGAEPAVERFLDGTAGLPELAAARANRDAAVALVAVDRAALVPTVAAFARERVTNAAGFGDAFNWAAGVQLTWSLDRRALGRVDQAAAAAATSALRVARAEQDARDRIVDAWDQVEALRAAAVAAAAEVDAVRLATTIAQTRNAQGTATLQQVVDAQAAQLDGEVGLVRARADLAAARALLRLAAGREAAP